MLKFKDLVAKQQHTNWVKLRVHQNQCTNYGKSGEKLQVLNRNNKVAISFWRIKGRGGGRGEMRGGKGEESEKGKGERGSISNQI